MTEPTNNDLLSAIQALGVRLEDMDMRLTSIEANMTILRAAFVKHGKHIGALISAGVCGSTEMRETG